MKKKKIKSNNFITKVFNSLSDDELVTIMFLYPKQIYDFCILMTLEQQLIKEEKI